MRRPVETTRNVTVRRISEVISEAHTLAAEAGIEDVRTYLKAVAASSRGLGTTKIRIPRIPQTNARPIGFSF